MQESDYWNRFWRRRISRRSLLSGAAVAGSGLAAAAVFGCNGASTNAPSSASRAAARTPGVRPLASLDAASEIADARRKFDPARADSRGGTLRYPGFDAVVLDRYDPHQTQFGPMYSNLSAVFSKLYMYKSHEEPTWENIVPDLAASQPETPDQLTYIVHLRKGVKFHNTDKARKNFPNVAGRELTADDVIFSYLRQANPNSPQRPYYYRSDQYDTIDKMEKIDDYTVKITTKEPIVPFRHFMADTNAMIIPKEIVDEGKDTIDTTSGPKPEERMIGTGPFTWGTLQWGIQFQGLRNPDWFGWDDPPGEGRPWIDGYVATGQGLNDATVEALFRQKKVDVASYIDNPTWIIDIKNEFPGIIYQADRISGWVNTRFKAYCKPFDDWRVRRAMHLAVDRQEIVDVMGAGQWFPAGPVNGAIKYWALPDDDLEKIAGYRRGADRDKDIQEARQLYEAAGKPAIPQAWFADIPAYITAYAPTYVETMKKNLDVKISTLTQSYGRIAEGHVKQDCRLSAFTFGYDNGWIDLDDWVYPYFRSKASKNSFQVSDPQLDSMLDAQRHEFDWDKRKQLGYDIQKYLLGETKQDAPAALVRLDYASPGGGYIAWPYLKNRTSWPWFGNSYWYAELWFDKNEPSYQGRPA